MQHRYLTRFATIWQNKLHVFVACTSNCPLRSLKALGLVYSGKYTQLIQLVYWDSTQILAQKQIIQIQHNRIKNPTSRKEQLAEDLNSGRPRTKAASGQSGTRTRDRRIAIHSATLTPSLKRLCLRVGHCCRTALSDGFVEAISSFIGYQEVRGKLCRNSCKTVLQRGLSRHFTQPPPPTI